MDNYQNNQVDDLSDRTVKFGFVPKDTADHTAGKIQENAVKEFPEQSIAYTSDPYLDDDNEKTIAFFDYEIMRSQKKVPSNNASAPSGSDVVLPPVPPIPTFNQTTPTAAGNNQDTNIYGAKASPNPYGKPVNRTAETSASKNVYQTPNSAPVHPANNAAAEQAAKEEHSRNKKKRIFIIIGTVLLAAAAGALVSVFPPVAFIPLIPIPFLYIFVWPRQRKTNTPEVPDHSRGR